MKSIFMTSRGLSVMLLKWWGDFRLGISGSTLSVSSNLGKEAMKTGNTMLQLRIEYTPIALSTLLQHGLDLPRTAFSARDIQN
jgi:hypothetical protein